MSIPPQAEIACAKSHINAIKKVLQPALTHSLTHSLLHLLTHFFTPSFSPVSTGVVQVADPANQPRDALWFIFEDDVQVRTGWKVVRWVAVGEGGRGVGVLALLSCVIVGVM